ncbi:MULTISPECIES: hypothetical protein [Bacillus amyloliquefaciens group]|nr:MULTISPECIES: hypothetical protein [Bacillus amyloliquefaciens group]
MSKTVKVFLGVAVTVGVIGTVIYGTMGDSLSGFADRLAEFLNMS